MRAAESQPPAGHRSATRGLGTAGSPAVVGGVARFLRGSGPTLLTVTAFALSALVVPMLPSVATTDDWTYARSAQLLLTGHG